MNLTGKELVEQGIITNVGEDCIQQHGVDLELIDVKRILGTGHVPVKGKTKLADRETINLSQVKSLDSDQLVQGWILDQGSYEVNFKQGCKVPADKMLLIRQRSSLMRNGANIHSAIFDAGFSTNQTGCVMIVTRTIIIEFGARVAQIYAHNSNVVENLYSGQFQGK